MLKLGKLNINFSVFQKELVYFCRYPKADKLMDETENSFFLNKNIVQNYLFQFSNRFYL